MKEREQNITPQIIEAINKHLSQNPPQELEGISVEGIAEKLGINKSILYGWVKTDTEFSGGLERLKESQEDSPFRSGTDVDFYVDAMMIAFLLLETKDRHYKPYNQ